MNIHPAEKTLHVSVTAFTGCLKGAGSNNAQHNPEHIQASP
jgi:hypothetical protein